jgi:hypothetical protein
VGREVPRTQFYRTIMVVDDANVREKRRVRRRGG